MKRFKNILYFADQNDSHTATLERAMALARSNAAHLTIMDVVEESDLSAEVEQQLGISLNEVLRQRRLEELAALIKPHQDSAGTIHTQVSSGTPFIELIKAVQRHRYDLVIKQNRPSTGFIQLFHGSTDMHILRKCPCPVWIDHSTSSHPYNNILVAVDPGQPPNADLNYLLMDLASSLAQMETAHLHVVHAWQLKGETMLRSGRARIPPAELRELLHATEQNHRQKLDMLLAKYRLTTESHNVTLVKASATQAITELSENINADLIVMGTVGRTGIPGLFIGNTAEEILQTTKASVLAVKPSGFESPIKAS